MKPIFIAGPCVIESAELLDCVAAEVARLQKKTGLTFYFKASFDKANRTSIHSYRGPGLEKGLQMLADVKSKYALPLLTDIHESYQAKAAGEVVDVLQIPAFCVARPTCWLRPHTQGVLSTSRRRSSFRAKTCAFR